MIVTLIGYRASGKSTVAPLLAKHFGCDWVDTDREIEDLAGTTIAEIFEQHGEEHFRDLETQTLKRLCESDRNLVIAAGGGIVLREENRQLMNAAGFVVWLTASVETLAKRMGLDPGTAANRPSLTGGDPISEIREVLESRKPLYKEAARMDFDTEVDSAETIANFVYVLLETQRSIKGETSS